MKRLAILFLVSLSSLLCYGQEAFSNPNPPSREQVLKMFDAMQSRKTVQAMMDSMQQQMDNLFKQQMEKTAPNASPEMRAEMAAAMQDMLKEMEPIINEMLEGMMPTYQKYLTSQEVEAITAFYLSPEGKSFIGKMPLIMNDSMTTAMKTMQDRMGPIGEKMAKRMEEITKKYAPQKSAPNPGAAK